MTRQEIFDKVAKHLRTQNKKAEGRDGCLYRAEDGSTCAIGCLIKDEHYAPELEQKTVESAVVQFALQRSGLEVTATNELLLKALQHVHDMWQVDKWPSELAKLAIDYKLSTAALEQDEGKSTT